MYQDFDIFEKVCTHELGVTVILDIPKGLILKIVMIKNFLTILYMSTFIPFFKCKFVCNRVAPFFL